MSNLADLMDTSFADKARAALYHVEADSFARHALWCDHSTRSLWPPRHGEGVEWSGNGAHGYQITVGHIGERPVCVSLTIDEIGGQTVLFYTAISQVVDHKMIEEWFAANLPAPRRDGGARRAHCDAMNFADCLHAIADAAKRQAA